MTLRSIFTGCGAYLPARIVTNGELAQRVDTSDEWIVQRTGIRQRHVAADGELTSDLGLAAAREALAAAGRTPGDIDLIVCATSTPDETFPATATRIQARLGMTRGAAFDVQAVCTGFVYGLSVADSMIRTGHAKRALVVGAETFSRILDWNDRTTCVLFGDGAGAVVLEAASINGHDDGRGLLSTHIYSDGMVSADPDSEGGGGGGGGFGFGGWGGGGDHEVEMGLPIEAIRADSDGGPIYYTGSVIASDDYLEPTVGWTGGTIFFPRTSEHIGAAVMADSEGGAHYGYDHTSEASWSSGLMRLPPDITRLVSANPLELACAMSCCTETE